MSRPLYIATLYAMLLIGVIGLSIVVVNSSDSWRGKLMGEGQFIEVASCVLWFVCALVSTIGALRLTSTAWAYIGGVTFLFGLRELDFDKKFTTMGILKSKFYFSDTVPIGEKIIGFAIVLLLLFLAVALVRLFIQTVRKNKYKARWVTGIAFTAFAMLAAAKILDGLPRKLADFGFETTPFAAQLFVAAEEVLELGAPLMVLLGLYAHYTTRYARVR